MEGSRPNRGIDVGEAHSHASIERRALALRKNPVLMGCALPLDAPLPARQVFERLDLLRRRDKTLFADDVPLEYAVEEAPHQSVLAWTKYDDRKFVVSVTPETYGGLEQGDGPAVFSLCHELGHVDLHHRNLLQFAEIPHLQGALRRTARPHPIFRDSEWQADAYAAALMMPAEGLALLEARGELTVENLRSTYGASWTAATIRFDNYRKRRDQLLDG